MLLRQSLVQSSRATFVYACLLRVVWSFAGAVANECCLQMGLLDVWRWSCSSATGRFEEGESASCSFSRAHGQKPATLGSTDPSQQYGLRGVTSRLLSGSSQSHLKDGTRFSFPDVASSRPALLGSCWWRLARSAALRRVSCPVCLFVYGTCKPHLRLLHKREGGGYVAATKRNQKTAFWLAVSRSSTDDGVVG